jgi:CRISPR-associated endoribonuclease Cas6
LRILLDLEALNDQQVLSASEYHKIQGFVYDQLISNTDFKGIHNLKSYKFFCFSNIFPPSIVKAGQIRHLLLSSPNTDLINSIFSYIKDNLIDDKIVDIGEQQYHIKSLELLEVKIVDESCVIRTSTPVSVRMSEKSYSIYKIQNEDRKKKFLYWRSNLSPDIFLALIINNALSKYKEFYKKDINKEDIQSIIQSTVLLKEVVIHIPIDTYTIKIPASFWRFHFINLKNEYNKEFLEFLLDTGIGERNSAGLGFLNAEDGVKMLRLARIV